MPDSHDFGPDDRTPFGGQKRSRRDGGVELDDGEIVERIEGDDGAFSNDRREELFRREAHRDGAP
ncbi:MAG: hypothetical protein IPG50_30455 [Myxococcales bacterium]|nr:hypothetical protein [Myxococcales bacterium]